MLWDKVALITVSSMGEQNRTIDLVPLSILGLPHPVNAHLEFINVSSLLETRLEPDPQACGGKLSGNAEDSLGAISRDLPFVEQLPLTSKTPICPVVLVLTQNCRLCSLQF